MKKHILSSFYWLVPLGIIALAHLWIEPKSEPYFNNDETRHVMTGVFFRDAIADGAWSSPRNYAVRYYLKYPALGIVVWPPFFYATEGVWMYFFGISFIAAKLLLAFYGMIAGIYFFLLLRQVLGPLAATCALTIIGFTPLVFEFSSHVMLELPCLALVLASVYHFERFLEVQKRGHAWSACFLAALAALTRFDGIVLLPFFTLRLLMTSNWRLLKRGAVLGGIAVALLLTGPYYIWTWLEYGTTITLATQQGTVAGSTSFLDSRNFAFYPTCIPGQVGWFVTIAALIGFFASLRETSRRLAGPFFALLLATYITFTPMAELEARHAIYWIPSLIYFAVVGCRILAQIVNRPKWLIPFALTILVGTATPTLRAPVYSVEGYEAAAQYVVANTREARVCLMDGFLNGSFIYHVRKHDPERRLWVLRGDKLLYSMLSDPYAAYEEHTKEKSQVLTVLDRYDPELIVVEEPQLYFELAAATRLREVLHENPQRFHLEATIPIRSNHFRFAAARLEIWRSLQRNPNRSEKIEIDMLNIGRSLGTDMRK